MRRANGYRYLLLTGARENPAAGRNYTSRCVKLNLQKPSDLSELATFEHQQQGATWWLYLFNKDQNISRHPGRLLKHKSVLIFS